jgi:hypothetical protein
MFSSCRLQWANVEDEVSFAYLVWFRVSIRGQLPVSFAVEFKPVLE